ncbi:threonine/serine exporter family protein [Clostridium sp. JS66]|uniref:threonine/serine exporter family protein n=1 Tax=Clostridium sp. JS66 TaxID=3064705 RepID=UPI00298ECD5B|nr:threonine/serine exporter family protein [Clostridium sp. JS66]WPC40822.1 threonine/serine exporter family protein [Clostridium sp. JS66]
MLLNVLYTLIATLCFGVLSNIRGKNLIFASLGGGLSWSAYLIASSYFHISNIFSFFMAALLAAAYSEIMARVIKTPVTTFIICAMIPLVPGGGMYNTMFQSVQGNANASLTLGLQTLYIAGTIAVGVFFISSIAKITTKFSKQNVSKTKK